MIEISAIVDAACHIDQLKAIIFDLDDTLYSEKEYVRSGYRAVAELLQEVPFAEAKLWEAFEHKQPAIDTVLLNAGIYSSELKHRCVERYRSHCPHIHLYDGVLELLRSLREQNYLIGLITDGRPDGQQAKIEALGLAPYMDHMIITDALGGPQWRKPHERAFVLMQKTLNIPFDKMCYVGDNIQKDFVAPQKLGMRCIWFQNPDGLYYSAK